MAGRCSVPGCERSARARGLCHTHYWRLRTFGDPTHGGPLPDRAERGCAIAGCDADFFAKGLCKPHYKRLLKYGDPLGSAKRTPAIERFLAKVNKNGSEPAAAHSRGYCWQFVGDRNREGYGLFWDGKRQVPAHRWSYEHFVGPIPEGLEIDHLCKNRGCVNPEHLEAVTPAVNVQRSDLAARRKTHCPAGHPYDEENTYINPSGARECRTCKSARSRAARQRRKGVG